VAFVIEMGNEADQTKQNQAQFAGLLLKKQYLDDRQEEKDLWALTKEHT